MVSLPDCALDFSSAITLLKLDAHIPRALGVIVFTFTLNWYFLHSSYGLLKRKEKYWNWSWAI